MTCLSLHSRRRQGARWTTKEWDEPPYGAYGVTRETRWRETRGDGSGDYEDRSHVIHSPSVHLLPRNPHSPRRSFSFGSSLGSPHPSSPYTLPFGAAGGVRRDEGSGEPPFGAPWGGEVERNRRGARRRVPKGWGESGRPARWEAASSLLCLSSSFLISWSNRSLIRFSSRSSVVRSLVTYSLPVPFGLLTRRGREPNERREWGTDRGSWWAAFTVTHAARPSWVVCSHRSLPYGVAPRSVGSFHSPPSRVATVGSGARWRDEQREERNRPVMEVRKEGTEG